MKFILGSANFTEEYGYLKKKIKINDLKKILSNFNGNFSMIDTAPSYGRSEKLIGKIINGQSINFTTKIAKFNNNNIYKIIDNFKSNFERSLKNLNTDNFYGIFFHNEKDLQSKNIDKFLKILDEYKSQKLIKKIGCSVYNLNNFLKLQKKYNFKIVQFPLNIFDINPKKKN